MPPWQLHLLHVHSGGGLDGRFDLRRQDFAAAAGATGAGKPSVCRQAAGEADLGDGALLALERLVGRVESRKRENKRE